MPSHSQRVSRCVLYCVCARSSVKALVIDNAACEGRSIWAKAMKSRPWGKPFDRSLHQGSHLFSDSSITEKIYLVQVTLWKVVIWGDYCVSSRPYSTQEAERLHVIGWWWRGAPCQHDQVLSSDSIISGLYQYCSWEMSRCLLHLISHGSKSE